MFKYSPIGMEEAWFMAPVEHSSNGKGFMAPMEYTPMVYRPNEKDMVSWKNVCFWSGGFHGIR